MKKIQINQNTWIGLFWVGLNFVSKVLFLSKQNVVGDEAFSIFYAQMSIPHLFGELVKGNNPPLYEIILHGWTFVFGISPMSVRFLSCVFASITVYIIYQIGVQFFSKRIGLLAAGFYTLSNFFIFFSHEARVYALFALLTTWSFLLFFKLGDDQKNYRRIFLLALVNSLLLYSHYFGTVVIFIQGLAFILIRGYRILFLKSYLWSYLITAGFYLPYAGYFLNRLNSVHQDGTWLKPPNRLEPIYALVVKMSNAPVIAVFFLLILVIALIKTIRSKRLESISKEQYVIFIWFPVSVLLVFLFSFVMPLFLNRYLLYSGIGFYFLLAFSIEIWRERSYLRSILTFLCLGGMLFTIDLNPSNHREVKSMVSYVKELNKESNNIVFMCPDYLHLSYVYHHSRDWFNRAEDFQNDEAFKEVLREENIFPISSSKGLDFNKIKTFDKVIYIDAAANFSYPNNAILPTLKDSLKLIGKNHFETLFDVYVFE